MQTTLIRDEFIVALSVDLPEQARFAAVRDAIGALIGRDHSERTGKIVKPPTRRGMSRRAGSKTRKLILVDVFPI